MGLLVFFAWYAEDLSAFPMGLLARYALVAATLITVATLLLTRSRSLAGVLRDHWKTRADTSLAAHVHTNKKSRTPIHYQRPVGSRLSPTAWTLLSILLMGILPYLVLAAVTYHMHEGRSGDVIGPGTFGLWVMFGWMATLPAAGLVLAILAFMGKLQPWPRSWQVLLSGGLIVLPLLPGLLLFVL
jgi:hypothetical protein